VYQNILVPLDGSDLAECVLPHVQSIATGCGVGKVSFVRVVEPLYLRPYYSATGVDDTGLVFADKEVKRIEAEERKAAHDYLNNLLARIKYDGASVTAEVIEGRVAESLADYATKNGVDLIVIATHGRSGVSRWVWGSVADRILRSACVPVLMVRAPGCVPGI
jgi:nucleotide-binding universal stress UspA family protein